MILSRFFGSAFAVALATTTAQADMLEVQNVTDGVYALVGPKEQRSAENLANNATFGVVVTDEGVVLMDPGGSYPCAHPRDHKSAGQFCHRHGWSRSSLAW